MLVVPPVLGDTVFAPAPWWRPRRKGVVDAILRRPRVAFVDAVAVRWKDGTVTIVERDAFVTLGRGFKRKRLTEKRKWFFARAWEWWFDDVW